MDPNTSAQLRRFGQLFARVLLCAIFLMSGFGKISDWQGTTGYMAAKGMPAVSLFLAGAILLELGGGLSLLLGFRARAGAAALTLFLIPATLIFHNFWAFEGMDQRLQMINFLKNLAILGGLIQTMVYGAGAFSLDARARSRRAG